MKAIRSISVILLALLVLISSTSFMVGVHLCMGEVQSVALFSKADVCPNEVSLPPCHRQTKNSCCDNETVVHKGEDFKSTTGQIEFAAPAPIVIDQPLVLISEIIPSTPAFHGNYYNYDPPLRSCDITVEHQVFLIWFQLLFEEHSPLPVIAMP